MSQSKSSVGPSLRSHFTSLLSKDRIRLFSFIRSLVLNVSDAEDVYQRVCLTLWNKFDEFDQKRDFFPWACGVASYTVRNHHRSLRHDRHYFDQELIETMSQQREQHLSNYNIRIEFLHQCLRALNSSDQQLLQDAVFEKQAVTEIAKTTKRSLQSLYNRLSILRRELAECISRKLQSEQ
ncbi:RNA polymerase sigma factor [Gimesia panareensis]|uniref:RNA polymerase sigma factor n=1 Tax=Gimesia panareensis TaxID=2527978 RepID=A0A518FPY4_9PLAN|nr:sigma-70 family RNA polymerase sigma factor [Gimesia panareensis]QDV18413.1 RNA polymerase sigma factor [Gimesia panareensis]